MVRLVQTGAEGEGPCMGAMEINRPGDLGDIASLGLMLAEAKRLLAGVQREIVAAQAKEHAVRQPGCSRCGRACQVKDRLDHNGCAGLWRILAGVAEPPVLGWSHIVMQLQHLKL